MKKNRFLYSLSAVALACIISFSGLGNTYIQAEATSVGIEKGVWNDDASVWDNLKQYLLAFTSASGLFYNPLATYFSAQDFYNFMISDGVSHDNAHGVFCDCDDETHTSFNGKEHGGGGFVRDGVSVDDGGNVTFSDDVSDLFHDFVLQYLETEYGYTIIKTISFDEIPTKFFSNSYMYNNLKAFFEHEEIAFIIFSSSSLKLGSTSGSLNFLGDSIKNPCKVIEPDWTVHIHYNYLSTEKKSEDLFNYFNVVQSDITSTYYESVTTYSSPTFKIYDSNSSYFRALVSVDGRLVKLWKNIDAYKLYSLDKQPYYVTDSWLIYDSSQDNSTTISNEQYQYYSDNSTNIHQTIQNNIVNYGDGLTESEVQNIVENTLKELLENGFGNGDTDNDSDNGGNGVGDLVGGIGDLLDTILSLIGKVMSVVADFTQSILDLFSGFTDFTDGFSNFLSGAFSFIPQEIWNVIQVGLSLMILLAVIKFLRK